MPRVSVIMNCLNCSKYLREAIDSVYTQTYGDWEIVFWDNASSDESAAIATSYDERVKYHRADCTIPLGMARNEAIKASSGEYIAFLDCDDLWMPEKLEKQIRLFEQEKNIGLVYCNTKFLNQSTGKERTLYRNDLQPKGKVFRELLSNYFLSMETVVIRRMCLENLSEWFDPEFNVIEEADLFTRISYHWDVGYVNEILAKWRMHGESWTWKKTYLFGKELKVMVKKYQDQFDCFMTQYGEEARRILSKAAYYEALEEWKRGNNNKARKILWPHIRNYPVLVVIYLLTGLSYGKYSGLLRLLGRHP